MKTLIAACVLAAAGAAQASTISGFNGPFAVANWSFVSTDDGSVNTAGAPASIVLTGGDSGFRRRLYDRFHHPGRQGHHDLVQLGLPDPRRRLLLRSLRLPARRRPGSLLFTQLTADGTDAPQNGIASVFVQAGDTFGFRGASIGSDFGAGITTIGEFQASSVPEPGALALVSLALLAAAATRRRQACDSRRPSGQVLLKTRHGRATSLF